MDDPMDYSQSLLVKQASARAKELVVEKQIISIKQQIEMSAEEEHKAILDDQKQRARCVPMYKNISAAPTRPRPLS